MNYRSIMTCLALAVLLTGCNEPNPLEKHPPEKVAAFLLEESKVPLAKCAKIWANPEASNNTLLTECAPTATQAAILLNEGGFGPGISAQNVQLQQIWPPYLKLVEERRAQTKKDAEGAFDWKKGR